MEYPGINIAKEIRQDWKILLTTDRLLFISALFIPVLFSAFFFCPTKILRILFYISLPFSLTLIWRDKAYIWDMIKSYRCIWGICAAFLLYMSFSVTWSYTDHTARYFEKGKLGLFIIIALISTSYITHKFPQLVKTTALSFLTAALISGTILLISYAIALPDMPRLMRLHGMGRADNPVQAALLYGLAIIILSHEKTLSALPILHRIALGTIPLTVMALTQSRGPFLALLLTLSALIVINARRKFLTLAVITIGMLAVSTASYTLCKETSLVERQSGGRIAIWSTAITQIKDHPIIGYGLANKTKYSYQKPNGQTEEVGHPHSLYLSTLIQGGIIGLVTFLVLMAMSAKYALLQNNNIWIAGWILMGAGLGMVDFGGYIINISTEWLVFWWPAAFTLGLLPYNMIRSSHQ